MSRRIEVELTSAKGDGTWTWRAAGAKQPKGVVDASLLYAGAQVGDVVRAEADFDIEGILITAVLPPKEKRTEPVRLEIIGPPREHQGVTSSLVEKSERPRSPRGRDGGERGGRPGRGGGFDDRRGGPSRPREDAGRPGGREARPRPEGASRSRTGGPGAGAERRPRPEGGSRPASAGRERRREAPAEATPKPKRLAPANVHRAAVVEALPPEQRPIAEQVLRGGIPAVRQAVEAQNAGLREAGQPEVHAGPLVAMAEQLLPQLKAAEWRDRAEAAAKVIDEVSLRDLRSVVAGADLARDDEGRILADTLRQALEKRVTEQREKWVADIAGSLDEGRLVRALRLSAHAPDPTSRFPAELAVRLSESAGAAMTADVAPERWATLLDAVASSPVRRTVKPVALPAEPGEALLQAARQASGRVPALAPLLGITMPPPPGPPRPGARPPRPSGPSAARRRPPAPGSPVPPAAGPPATSAPPTPERAPEPAMEAAAPAPTEPVEPAVEAAAPATEPAAPAPQATVEATAPAAPTEAARPVEARTDAP